LGKRPHSLDARHNDELELQILKLAMPAAEQTANDLAALADLRATRERITAAAENADDEEL
jgi:hypothetical protein